jgi:plasmid maintenance system killer protein
MPKVSKILEKKNVFPFLRKRGLFEQYKKAKRYLLEGNQLQLQVKFKERNPKGSGIWYFRINKQFRALGVFDEEGDLIIFDVDNHQK